jgi:predicted N-formylglutamate amidohydrolase
MIEIRQDEIASEAAAKTWAGIIRKAWQLYIK